MNKMKKIKNLNCSNVPFEICHEYKKILKGYNKPKLLNMQEWCDITQQLSKAMFGNKVEQK